MNDILSRPPDNNGIINMLPEELSKENKQKQKKFGSMMFMYDLMQEHIVRPRLHKANPQKHREILNALISEQKDSRILEIACGTGGAIHFFNNRNEYTGLDLSYPMLKQAVKKSRNKNFKSCRFIQGNAEELLFDDQSFDFVLMDTALHMIPEYKKAIAETTRVLKKKGIFICTTPTLGINADFDKKWIRITEKRGINTFTEDAIRRICLENELDFSRYATNGGILYFKAQK